MEHGIFDFIKNGPLGQGASIMDPDRKGPAQPPPGVAPGLAGAPIVRDLGQAPPRKSALLELVTGFIEQIEDRIADKVVERLERNMKEMGEKLKQRLSPEINDEILYGMATLDGDLERPERVQPNIGRLTEEELAALLEPKNHEEDLNWHQNPVIQNLIAEALKIDGVKCPYQGYPSFRVGEQELTVTRAGSQLTAFDKTGERVWARRRLPNGNVIEKGFYIRTPEDVLEHLHTLVDEPKVTL